MFLPAELNARGLVQLIARRSWQVGSGHGRRLHAGRLRGRQWHTGALQASSHGTSCPALPCWLRFFMSAATCAVAAEQGLPPLPLPAQLEPSQLSGRGFVSGTPQVIPLALWMTLKLSRPYLIVVLVLTGVETLRADLRRTRVPLAVLRQPGSDSNNS